MKKYLVIAGWMSSLFAANALADDAASLQSRLNRVNSFHASFTQQVTDASGADIQQGQGELWVKRPSLFNWHMTAPDESTIVSDGKTLWFYNPFVEQVSATWLKNATSNTPFMLIARNQSGDWGHYHVKQQGDHFSLTPKGNNGNLKQFSIDVSPEGTINQFSAVEQDGQRSSYRLTSQKNGPIEASKFQFTPPKGVTVDDQRQ